MDDTEQLALEIGRHCSLLLSFIRPRPEDFMKRPTGIDDRIFNISEYSKRAEIAGINIELLKQHDLIKPDGTWDLDGIKASASLYDKSRPHLGR